MSQLWGIRRQNEVDLAVDGHYQALATPEPATPTPRRDVALSNFPTLSTTITNNGGANIYSEWYMGAPGQRLADPAKTAYENAVKMIEKDLTTDEQQMMELHKHNTAQDVQVAVEKALEEYQTKSRGSRAREWLSSCSSRVMYYGAVFDTFSQHHPEYVSLAWGALKFLFIAVLNHEELLVEISKAVSRIADVLPRTKLHSELYPTEKMQDTVSQLYAKIIAFELMAIKWYKKGKIAHSISSIIKPFSLGFKPVIDEINERSRRVDELASAASKAEIRGLNVSLHDTRQDLRNIMQDFQQLKSEMFAMHLQQQSFFSQSILTLQKDSMKMFRDKQVEDIRTTMLLEDTPVAEDSLAWCRSMRDRRRQKAPTQLPLTELSKLKLWISEPSSSLLLAQGQGVKTSPLDFVADFLDVIIDQDYPVIWALPSTVMNMVDRASGISVSGLLRSLVSQALCLKPGLINEGANPLTAKHFRTATTIQDWFGLFERCVANFPRLFIVVDMSIIETASAHQEAEDQFFGLGDFVDHISQLVSRRSSGGLKIIVASWKFNLATSMDSEDVFADMQIFTDRGRKVERLMRQPKYRAAFRRKHQNFHDKFRSSVL